MAKTVVGIFRDLEQARSIVEALHGIGFSYDEIGLVARPGAETAPDASASEPTHYGTDAVAGAEAGAVVGGATGFLLGVVAFALPIAGPIIAAGTIAATLAGVGIGAATGGLLGALTHHGVPMHEAEQYVTAIERGGVVVTVTVPDERAAVVTQLFESHNARGPVLNDIPESERIDEPLHFNLRSSRNQTNEDPIQEVSTTREDRW